MINPSTATHSIRFLSPDDPVIDSRYLSNNRFSWHSLIAQPEPSWSQRFSRNSILSSWRLSRTTLGPESLAIFESLENRPPSLQFDIISQNEKEPATEAKSLETASRSEYNRDLKTRNICILATVLGFLVGVAILTIGAYIIASGKPLLPLWLVGKYITLGNLDYPFAAPPHPNLQLHYLSDHRIFPLPQAAMISTSLVLNICLTLIFDAMNYIPATTLRWSLWQEGRLHCNSNSRLFTGAHHFAPNSWYANAVSCVTLVLGYGAVSVLTSSVYVIGEASKNNGLGDENVSGPRWALDFNAWGMVGLGSALFVQSLLCSWCFISGGNKMVQTWSSNPLSTARASAVLHLQNSTSNFGDQNQVLQTQSTSNIFKSARSEFHNITFDNSPQWHPVDPTLTVPRTRQPPASALVKPLRRLTNCIWVVLAALCVWMLIVGIIGKRTNTCRASFVVWINYRADFFSYFSSYCQVGVSYYGHAYHNRRDWLGLIIQCMALAIITLGLHCVETITQVTRDEAIWRKLTTTGANPDAGAMMESTTAWQCWVLFAFKSVTPWMFGYALQCNLSVWMNLIPISVLAFLFVLLGLFAEFLIRYRPKGPQPATYGIITVLVSLVDEWDHRRLYWGDKGVGSDGFRRAGTAGQRLADLDMKALYTGLRQRTREPR
jgi:hypothetical protein